MMVLCGTVTGRKKGTPKESGKTFSTLKVEVGDKTYYPLYEEGTIKPQKDQPITLVCNVNADVFNGKPQLRLFATGFVSDEMIIDPLSFDSGNSKFEDWD